jgi:2-polyprenyl-3-methyl-5-hydroxy-6-metoxy-1,4-benzoquinol methylase
MKDQASTIAFYEEHAEEYCETTSHLDLNHLHGRFLRELQPGAHILDAGCGSGRDSKAFLDRGFRVTAIDASPRVIEVASKVVGGHCQVLRFQEMAFREVFDGIWACASILHIPKREIPDIMARFVMALKHEGVLYLSVKQGKGERLAKDGRFFSSYTENSLRSLALQFRPALREVALWKTDEMRSGVHSEPWLNILLRKNGDQHP